MSGLEKKDPNKIREVQTGNVQYDVNKILHSKTARDRHLLFTPNSQTDSSNTPQDRVQDSASERKLTNFNNDSGYWSAEESSHEDVSHNKLHEDASKTLVESRGSDDDRAYKSLGYEVPKGREGMETKTVREYLKEIRSSANLEDRQWMLDMKLGDFQEFWENKPLEFEKVENSETRSQTFSKKKEVFKYSGKFGEAELGIGEDQKWEPWEVPEFIGDKRVFNVLGEGNDCLLRSLGKAAGVKDLENFVDKGREYLVEKRLTQSGKMLDLGTSQGVELVEQLRDKNKLSSERGIRVHTFSPTGKLRYIDVMSGIEGQRPYEVFLMNGHFRALVDTGKSSREHEKTPIRVNETSTVDSSAKRELTDLLFETPKGDDRKASTDLEGIKERIAKNQNKLREVRVSLDEVYEDVKSRYPEMVGTKKTDNNNDMRSREFLNYLSYKLSEKRLLDLITKLSPTDFEGKYEQAIKKYCKEFKPGEKHLDKIIDVMEANKNAVGEWLFENRKIFTAQLAERKPILPYTDGKNQFYLETRNDHHLMGY